MVTCSDFVVGVVVLLGRAIIGAMIFDKADFIQIVVGYLRGACWQMLADRESDRGINILLRQDEQGNASTAIRS